MQPAHHAASSGVAVTTKQQVPSSAIASVQLLARLAISCLLCNLRQMLAVLRCSDELRSGSMLLLPLLLQRYARSICRSCPAVALLMRANDDDSCTPAIHA